MDELRKIIEEKVANFKPEDPHADPNTEFEVRHLTPEVPAVVADKSHGGTAARRHLPLLP